LILEVSMAEIVHLVIKNPQFPEQRRRKLPDAVSGIPPANLEQEIADALKMDIERRLELKSKIDELSTKELERLLSYSAPRVVG
jgi:hypothetical protein